MSSDNTGKLVHTYSLTRMVYSYMADGLLSQDPLDEKHLLVFTVDIREFNDVGFVLRS